jgi:hypothetical protein
MVARTITVNEKTEKAIHEATLRLLAGIGAYFLDERKPINEIIFAPLALALRIVRTYEAVGLLLEDDYPQEAAVLALTMFELRFDLLYVASDIKRATQWVEHDNPKALSVSMKDKLLALFARLEAERLYDTFRVLSGIKHGNPLYSELAFPGRAKGRAFSFSSGPMDHRFGKALSAQIRAYAAYQLIWAAQVVNKLVAQYAVLPRDDRQKVQDLFTALRPVEAQFRRFLKRRTSARASFFGLRALRRGKSR